MLIYKINVLSALKKNGYTTTKLRKEKLLGENAIQALRRGEMVGNIVLDKVCGMLDMQPGDLIQYVDVPEE